MEDARVETPTANEIDRGAYFFICSLFFFLFNSPGVQAKVTAPDNTTLPHARYFHRFQILISLIGS